MLYPRDPRNSTACRRPVGIPQLGWGCDFRKEQKAGGEAARVYEHFPDLLILSIFLPLRAYSFSLPWSAHFAGSQNAKSKWQLCFKFACHFNFCKVRNPLFAVLLIPWEQWNFVVLHSIYMTRRGFWPQLCLHNGYDSFMILFDSSSSNLVIL